ncbi:MAG TPA: response regulator [Tahibacter sp.]|uniref:response regulator n=1 Tax=Tahibacter sp. TaxID=2056211 RepID=UPI002BDB34C0|nr:response regulator [Tahibacter sp.]HSX59013.1 response regulator [Tahibacter sp.]
MSDTVPWVGGTTVVVDDNAASAAMLAEFLRLIGHCSEVLPVTTVEAVADAILARSPDIAFLDLSLAGIDGREIASALRAGGSRTHLIAITGFGRPEDIESTRRAGFDEHWVKPLDIDRVERFMAAAPRRVPEPSAGGESVE